MADGLIVRRGSGSSGNLQCMCVGSANGTPTNYTVTFNQNVNPKEIVAAVLIFDVNYTTIHGGYNENYEKLMYTHGGSNYYTTINSVTETQMNISVNYTTDGYSHSVRVYLLCK